MKTLSHTGFTYRNIDYLIMGGFYYNKMISGDIDYDKNFYTPKHSKENMGQSYGGTHKNWQITKQKIEDKLKTRIRFYNTESASENNRCFFIELPDDALRIYFDEFDDRIILRDMLFCEQIKLMKYFSRFFDVSLVGDNKLVQIKP